MNFALTSDQRELAAAVRDLLDKECAPAVARAGDVAAIWPKLAEMGVLGVTVPEPRGLGLGYVEMAAVSEEAGRVAEGSAPLRISSRFAEPDTPRRC